MEAQRDVNIAFLSLHQPSPPGRKRPWEGCLTRQRFTFATQLWKLSAPTDDISNLESDLKQKGLPDHCQ